MPTVDLTAPAPPPEFALDGLPRRVTLTLPELESVAQHAGGAPLPFEQIAADDGDTGGLDSRLGATPQQSEDTAASAARASLRDAEESLNGRGLLIDGQLDDALRRAVGLLATPLLALDLDVAAGELRARAWHRARDGVVASLSTVDGLVFELAWFGVDQWSTELARVAVLPEDVTIAESAVPRQVRLPLELADAVGESLRSGRADLLPVLAAAHGDAVRVREEHTDEQISDAAGDHGPWETVPAAQVPSLVSALHQESRGRLRALLARVGPETGPLRVGVVSWSLLRDGWHALSVEGEQLDVRRVQPADLAAALAPVLTEVTA